MLCVYIIITYAWWKSGMWELLSLLSLVCGLNIALAACRLCYQINDCCFTLANILPLPNTLAMSSIVQCGYKATQIKLHRHLLVFLLFVLFIRIFAELCQQQLHCRACKPLLMYEPSLGYFVDHPSKRLISMFREVEVVIVHWLNSIRKHNYTDFRKLTSKSLSTFEWQLISCSDWF